MLAQSGQQVCPPQSHSQRPDIERKLCFLGHVQLLQVAQFFWQVLCLRKHASKMRLQCISPKSWLWNCRQMRKPISLSNACGTVLSVILGRVATNLSCMRVIISFLHRSKWTLSRCLYHDGCLGKLKVISPINITRSSAGEQFHMLALHKR